MSKEFTKSYAINRIAELNEQIVEMTAEQSETMRYLNKLRDNNKQLKQQLAEKDKEIEKLNKTLEMCKHIERYDIGEMFLENAKLIIEKRQFAIQELEKTLNFIENVFDKALKNCSLNNGYYDQILDFIDQQIKELKGE